MATNSKRSAPAKRPKKRAGRPSRASASAKALAALHDAPSEADPKAILAEIAADRSAPAAARVTACRLLLGDTGTGKPEGGDDLDEVTALAVKLLGRRR